MDKSLEQKLCDGDWIMRSNYRDTSDYIIGIGPIRMFVVYSHLNPELSLETNAMSVKGKMVKKDDRVLSFDKIDDWIFTDVQPIVGFAEGTAYQFTMKRVENQ